MCLACLFADQDRTNIMESFCQIDFLSVLKVTLLHGISVPEKDLEGELPYSASSQRQGHDTALTVLWLSKKLILWGGNTSTSHL